LVMSDVSVTSAGAMPSVPAIKVSSVSFIAGVFLLQSATGAGRYHVI
jgi:hypothetical protein